MMSRDFILIAAQLKPTIMTREEFYAELKRLRVYRRFMRAWKNEEDGDISKYVFLDKSHNFYDKMLGCLVFDNTEEGHDFWWAIASGVKPKKK